MKRLIAIILTVIFILEPVTILHAEEESIPQTIAEFEKLDDASRTFIISAEQKPTEEELVARMPKVLNVRMSDSEEWTEIETSWYCVGGDYTETEAFYYQFSPAWDGMKYAVASGTDVIVDIPYISVFFTTEGTEQAAVTASANEEIIFEFFIKEMGWNVAGASGVLANIFKESGFNPNTMGDRGTSYGICQWHNKRWTNMKNWCNSNGYDWTTLTGQLYYLKYELSQNNSNILYNGKTIYNYIVSVPNTAEGAYQAGYYWCYYFEIPANKASASKTRGNLAKNTYWPEYSKLGVPAVPEIQSCTSPSSDRVVVTWNAIANAEEYKIERRVVGEEAYQMIAAVSNVNSYTDTGLKAGGFYEYRVYASNILGTSAASAVYAVCTLPDSPKIQTITIAENKIEFSWEAVESADEYVIEKHVLGNPEEVNIVVDASVMSHVDDAISGDRAYSYSVHAVNEAGMSIECHSSKIMGTAPQIYGDVNGDGMIDTSDAQMIFGCFMAEFSMMSDTTMFGDVNDDGMLDTTDAQAVFNYFIR